ncbi:20533_t:CDS:2, partial [Dentiscutata erythropus]
GSDRGMKPVPKLVYDGLSKIIPCYANTIIKVKCVRRNEKEDAKIFSVWAIGTYPTGCGTNEIEMILFVPTNSGDRDPESQAIFRRDEYYSVSGKIVSGNYSGNMRPKMIVFGSTHLTIVDRALDSNKYPLKVSLVGVPQGASTEIKNTENSIIETLISDYNSQHINYIAKVVFSHVNPRLSHFKTTIRPQESIIYVIGQMEIIGDKYYVYANEINLSANNNETLLLTNPTRSKLLHLHQSMDNNSENIANYTSSTNQDEQPNNNVTPSSSSNIENMYQNNNNIIPSSSNNIHQNNQSNDNTHSAKRKRSEELDDLFVYPSQTKKDNHINENESNLKDANQGEKLMESNNATQKNYKKGKEPTTRATRNTKKPHNNNLTNDIPNSEKE